jgi:hypothetical protein
MLYDELKWLKALQLGLTPQHCLLVRIFLRSLLVTPNLVSL